MKQKIINYFLVVLLNMGAARSMAQPPPPPLPQTGHGSANNQVPGGGAPVGSGTLLLISLAGLYGGKKVYLVRKSNGN
jgi:hypothetical protein